MTKPAKRLNRQLAKIVKDANDYLRLSAQDQAVARAAIQHFVAKQLLDAGCYNGFRYLAADELQSGYRPGIIFAGKIIDGVAKNVYPDPSRVQFFL